jgi:hypothetical protein
MWYHFTWGVRNRYPTLCPMGMAGSNYSSADAVVRLLAWGVVSGHRLQAVEPFFEIA